MAKITLQGTGTVGGVSRLLQERIPESGISCTLVERVSRRFSGGTAELLVFEKYYMRNSSRASLSVLISGPEGNTPGTVIVDAIGAGGGQGALFSFSWGAEEAFAGIVEKILEPEGFRA